jgi:hypothetical protein
MSDPKDSEPLPRARVVSHTRTTGQCGIDTLGRLAAERRAARTPTGGGQHPNLCNPGEGLGPLTVRSPHQEKGSS